MTYKPLFLIGLAFPLFSCGGNKQAEQPEEAEARVLEYPVTISFDKGIETEREVLLSEIRDLLKEQNNRV